MPPPATVLLVAPPGRERDVLAAALTAGGFRVGTAESTAGALLGLAGRSAHAVVLSAPDLDACRRIRDADPRIGIIAVASRDTVDDRIAALTAGADDCLTRPYAARELVARAHALTRRMIAGETDEFAYADIRIDPDAHAAWRGDRRLDLTATELRLLTRLLERPEAVRTRRELLLGVWGYDPGPASNCLGVYIGYLRRKLELAGEPRLVHTVRGAGYVLRATEELRKSGSSALTTGADRRLIPQFCPSSEGAR